MMLNEFNSKQHIYISLNERFLMNVIVIEGVRREGKVTQKRKQLKNIFFQAI
jgi:hypothetical protein